MIKRLFKWLGFTLLALLFLLTASLGVAYYYQAEILAAVNQELKKRINGDIRIGSVGFGIWNEFPSVSITLNDIYIRGPHYDRYPRDFFEAKKVYLHVRLWPLLRKTIAVRSVHVSQGAISIFRSRSGYTNLDVFKSDKAKDTIKTRNPILVSFSRVRWEDVGFSFQDSLKGKSIGFHFTDIENRIAQTDSSGRYSLTGPMKFDGLIFNSSKGGFLKEKTANVQLDFEFNPGVQELVIHPSTLEFPKSSVNLSGSFYFAAPGKFVLKAGSAKLDYDEGISLLTQSLQAKLERFKIEKPVNVTATIYGTLAPHAQPAVDIAFQFSDSKVRASAMVIEQVTLDGTFSNHVRRGEPSGDHNSRVQLNNVAGIFQGLPMKGTATFYDLQYPRVTLKSNISINLRAFNDFVDTDRVKFSGGRFISQFEYSGKLKEFLDSTKTKYEGKLTGSVQVNGGSFQYISRKQHYEDMEVSLNFTQDHVLIKNVSCMINKSRIIVRGDGYGFIPFFLQPEKKGYARLHVYSPALDVAAVIGKKASLQRKSIKKKRISRLIDVLYEKVEFDLAVQADQLFYQRLQGSKMKGMVVLANDKLEAKNFTMDLAGGTIGFSLSLANLQNQVNPLFMTGTVRNADIKKFFYSFNNFSLTSLTHENLEGKIYMTAKLRAATDDDFTILTRRLAGDVQFSIKRGKLRNFEPLENMSNFLFKKRDFSNVAFGEIKSRLTFHGSAVDISKMEVESSVLRLFVEGRYSLKDSMNLEVQIPLSNLKRRDKHYKPENVGIDARVGPSVFLHVYRDPEGKTVIAYDPFKKHVRKTAKKGKSSGKIKS